MRARVWRVRCVLCPTFRGCVDHSNIHIDFSFFFILLPSKYSLSLENVGKTTLIRSLAGKKRKPLMGAVSKQALQEMANMSTDGACVRVCACAYARVILCAMCVYVRVCVCVRVFCLDVLACL